MNEIEANVITLSNYLNQHQQNISCVESCTGGLLSATLSDKSGASNWFWGGFVTYANNAKTQLGVDEKIIETYGAVSKECAKAMVIACQKKSATNIAISITGIAGPDGATQNKPVGYVCFGFGIQNKVLTSQTIFKGNRNKIRKQAVEYSLNQILKLL